MKTIAVIPARFASTRFPGKMLKDLNGAPVIVRTFQAAVATGLFDQVYVATDHELIEKAITEAGGKAIRSIKDHESGSDRIAEAVADLDANIIVNVQGDEPFINQKALADVLAVFQSDTQQTIDLASLMVPLTDWEEIQNPNIVKVITDVSSNALYFSRSVIPHPREGYAGTPYYRHLGIYAFRKQALLDFAALPMGKLEGIEKLEQLRYLENGKRIRMVETDQIGVGIDTEEDLIRARLLWK